ncbi:MAG: helix-turn-helix domain-containing protein [Lachnospiraceae bacterium]|nr:helix-turn-helix domain-containing protein [Lachnospiraceae bacterium]
MLSFQSLCSSLSSGGYAASDQSLRDPEQAVNDVMLQIYPGLEDNTGTAFVLRLSEFINAGSHPQGLYILLPDRQGLEHYRPSVGNWIMLQAEYDLMTILQFAKYRLNKSQRLDAATIKLSHSLLTDDSVEQLLKIGAEELSAPIFCSDNSTKVMFWSDKDQLAAMTDDDLVQSITTYGFVTEELYDKYDYGNYLPIIAQSDTAFIRTSSYPNKRDRIVSKLVINGVYFGWLVAVRAKDAFTESDCEIMDVISRMVTLELEKQRTSLPYGFQENLLMELMSNQISDSVEFWNRARCFNWAESDSYRLLVMDFRDRKALQDEDRIALSMKKHLTMLFPGVNIISLRNRLGMLLETDQIEATLSQLEPFVRYYKLEVAISTCFHDIIDFPSQFEAVSDLLNFGQDLKPGESFFYYDELAQYHMLSRMSMGFTAEELYSPEFARLLAYDRQHDTDYLETLRVYLKSQNVLTASKQLHVHRNTMNYRLQKIEEIIGCNLDMGDVIYRLWLSLVLYQFSIRRAALNPEQ